MNRASYFKSAKVVNIFLYKKLFQKFSEAAEMRNACAILDKTFQSMKIRNVFLTLLLPLLFWKNQLYAQLKPGFDKAEYHELLLVSGQSSGIEAYIKKAEKPQQHTMMYRAPLTGLDNRWDLWMREDGVVTISIRGTTAAAESWLANFYAAMVPAEGTLHLSDSSSFSYRLSEHITGWTSPHERHNANMKNTWAAC